MRRLGHEPVFAPVLAIRDLATPAPPLADVGALIVTSRHAAGATACIDPSPPVFAVGAGTAAALAAAGVPVAGQASGDGAALADLISARLRPEQGALVHPTGTVRAAGLAAALEAAGFDYRPWPVYSADPVDRLPEQVVAALADGAIDAVTLHSPRTARLFGERLVEAGVVAGTEALVALTLSANVADAIRSWPWREIRIAERSDERGMAALLEELRH